MEHAEHSNSNAPMEYRSEIGRLNILGFWIFLGAEIALFSTLFATYAVLHNRTAGGVLPAELFDAKARFNHDVPAVNEQFHMRHCSA